MVVMQAYTKNASWNNYLPSLLAMQRATYEAVRNNRRALLQRIAALPQRWADLSKVEEF